MRQFRRPLAPFVGDSLEEFSGHEWVRKDVRDSRRQRIASGDACRASCSLSSRQFDRATAKIAVMAQIC
jgi:hypothetical protein